MTCRVLVVDDQPATNEVVSRYLGARGLVIESVSSGAAAIAHCREALPDVILMDVQMPVMDGLEAARQIRELPGAAQTLIIAFTALAMPGDRERCLAAGMDDYVSKPIRMAELYDRVMERWEIGRP